MKNFTVLLLLIWTIGCTKHKTDCNFPTFNCLQGNWIEKEHTDSPLQLKEYIQVTVANNREILYDWNSIAESVNGPEALGEYYFAELPQQDSVALTAVWFDYSYHRYLKMISDNEIEIDYGLAPNPPTFKKTYIRFNGSVP